VGVALAIALLAVGVHMIRPSWGERGTRADVGVAVVTTTVISLAIFVLQVLDENRLQRQDANREAASANEALRLQLGLSPHLKGMNLNDEDLHGINLPNRDLSSAQFIGSDLSEANLNGANLANAQFNDARIKGANLARADLENANLNGADVSGETQLDSADLTDASLVGAQLQQASLNGAKLKGANLQRADMTGAGSGGHGAGLYFDGRTVFPNGKTLPCKSGFCTLKEKQWNAVQG